MQNQKLVDVSEYLDGEAGLKVETWEKMPWFMNLDHRYTRETQEELKEPVENHPAGGRLDTIAEVESNYSERSEEELELSGLVRSYREFNKKWLVFMIII